MRDLINLIEAADADPLGIVASIRDLEHDFKVRANLKYPQASFHLTPCGRCKAPVWLQPCPVCDYYPRGPEDGMMRIDSDEWREMAARYRSTAYEKFEHEIRHYGNIASWFFTNYRKTVAYKEDGFFKRVLDEVIKETMEMTFPDAEHIWRAYGPELTESLDDDFDDEDDVGDGNDWYSRRDELEPDMIFNTVYGDGGYVKLDRRVPGDGTKWYVADWWNGSWAYMDSTIEPSDLEGEPLMNDEELKAKLAQGE